MIPKILKAFLFLIIIVNSNYSITFRILWWNVYDFFDTIDTPSKKDKIFTEEEYRNKLLKISNELKNINADIVGLGEIENINILKEIAKNSGYEYYYLEEGNDPRGIDIALLSKYKVEKYITNKNRYTPYDENPNYKFSRDATLSILTINEKKIYIIMTHLKSGLKDESDQKKRIAQVFGLLDIIDEIYQKDKDPNIIIMGDFNTYRHTEPLNILEKSGLIIINYFYDEKITYTYKYKKNKKDLDYFIINKNLDKKLKYKSLKTFNSKKFLKISDHFPLLFEIRL